jgi:hypothetical protein
MIWWQLWTNWKHKETNMKMKVVAVVVNTARRGIKLTTVGVIVAIIVAISLSVNITPASANSAIVNPLCGDGSAPDYGFTYDLQQAHWTVDWENYVSEQAVNQVDAVLDRLDGDSIAQTMILIQSQAQVGNRVNCAVHFLRYMKLGLPDGERKDNGFVFVIVVEPTLIDVHYGVGLGLPALTASELTALNRAAEDAYDTTHSLDQALLTLVKDFDTVARSKYVPLISPPPISETANLPQLPSGPLGILSICGLLCLGLPILFLVLIWMSRNGVSFNPNSFGSRGGMGNPFGGGGGRGSSPTRGGGGSGRSGRGN